ncbi:MAG: phosphoribosylglycinamide formyltransferase [Aquirufa sp.]
MKNLVLFASGSGSNAEKIIEHFKGSDQVQITHIYCNNPTAGIIQRAERLGVPCRVFDRESYKNGTVLKEVQSLRTDWIILAGFLWLIPADFVKAFPQRIVNIHPALLPKFGGKGMYGHFVHEAVVAAGEKESGITIHYVNEHYDEGATIFQSSFPVLPSDTPEDVAKKGQVLEHRDFPRVIESRVLPASSEYTIKNNCAHPMITRYF